VCCHLIQCILSKYLCLCFQYPLNRISPHRQVLTPRCIVGTEVVLTAQSCVWVFYYSCAYINNILATHKCL
jgi:hypothetical protein